MSETKIREEQISSGSATDGQVLTADGAGAADWEDQSAGADANAIHDNVASEIHAVTEKTTPVDDDEVLIEDSADSYNKKRVKMSNLPSGGGGYGEGASAYHNANQSIPNTTWTAVALNSERYDTDTIHDPSTNNTRLTCKTAGVYTIHGKVTWGASATGERHIGIVLNGTTYIEYKYRNAVASMSMEINLIYFLDVADYIELQVYQSSGGALNVITGDNSPTFTMQRIG